MESRIKVGDTFQYSFSFNQKDVIAFAEASGDKNPIHLDNEYAENTIFKKRILHGFLGGSVFSKVFGTIYPGEGTIYLKQDLTFLKPMYISIEYTALFTILEVNAEKNRALVKTQIVDSENTVIIDGEALIKHKRIY
jgi:3-hydroxybutyryl-CoA dehydratase